METTEPDSPSGGKAKAATLEPMPGVEAAF